VLFSKYNKNFVVVSFDAAAAPSAVGTSAPLPHQLEPESLLVAPLVVILVVVSGEQPALLGAAALLRPAAATVPRGAAPARQGDD